PSRVYFHDLGLLGCESLDHGPKRKQRCFLRRRAHPDLEFHDCARGAFYGWLLALIWQAHCGRSRLWMRHRLREFLLAEAGCDCIGGPRYRSKPAAIKQRSGVALDRKSTRLNSSHVATSYAVFCLKKKTQFRTRLPY